MKHCTISSFVIRIWHLSFHYFTAKTYFSKHFAYFHHSQSNHIRQTIWSKQSKVWRTTVLYRTISFLYMLHDFVNLNIFVNVLSTDKFDALLLFSSTTNFVGNENTAYRTFGIVQSCSFERSLRLTLSWSPHAAWKITFLLLVNWFQ